MFKTQVQVNSFMNHLEQVSSNIERLSRWPVLVQTNPNISYDIEYTDILPQR
jgi:hypothetical protein